MKKDSYNLKNVLRLRGTIDPATIRFAEHMVDKQRKSPGVCYDPRVEYKSWREQNDR